MSELFIGPRERRILADLRDRAAAEPVNFRQLMQRMTDERFVLEHMRRMRELTVLLPMSYSVTFCIEADHPCGRTMRHMSMITSSPGMMPSSDAAWMVAIRLGFRGELSDCINWVEDTPDGRAINIAQAVERVEVSNEA